MKCPACGKRIGTFASMIFGERCTNWHTPKRGSNAPTIGKNQCIGSGSVVPKARKRANKPRGLL